MGLRTDHELRERTGSSAKGKNGAGPIFARPSADGKPLGSPLFPRRIASRIFNRSAAAGIALISQNSPAVGRRAQRGKVSLRSAFRHHANITVLLRRSWGKNKMSLEVTDILDIYAVTAKGTEQLRSGSTSLPVAAIELMVMFDGRSSISEIAHRAGGLPGSTIQDMLPELIVRGYIEVVRPGKSVEMNFGSFFVPAPATGVPAAEMSVSDTIRKQADKAEESLNVSGYYVSIARQASEKRPPANGSKYSVLVVDDNEPLLKVLSVLLRVEGFEARTAANRDQIVAALRSLPSPDAILLDATLPDANGFDILAKIRQHPVLKAIPIIMLTGLTSRKDVLRGLAGGANGYITKPFDHEVLIRGLRAVLGLQ